MKNILKDALPLGLFQEEQGPLCKKMKPDLGQLKTVEKVSVSVITDPKHKENNLIKITEDCKGKFDFKSNSVLRMKEIYCVKLPETSVKSAISDPAPPKEFGIIQHASSTLAYPTLTKASSTIEAILAENVKGSVVLVDVLVLCVKDKQLISKAVQNLSMCRPVVELRHLKRVNIVKMDDEECSQRLEVANTPARTVVVKEQSLNCNKCVCENIPSLNDQKVGLENSVKMGYSSTNESNGCSKDMVLLYVDLMESLINVEEVEGCCAVYELCKTITDAEPKECFPKSSNFKNLFPVNNCKVLEILKNKLNTIKVDMSLFSDVLYVSKVSRYPPRLRHLFEVATKYWPCTFHEDGYITKMLTGDVFDECEVKQVLVNMNRALSLASKCSSEMRSLMGQTKCAPQTPSSSQDCGSVSDKKDTAQHVQESFEISQNLNSPIKKFFLSSGMDEVSTSIDYSNNNTIFRSSCILFDSSKNSVIVEAVDSRHSHPLAHAAMVAVDLVGHQLGGGAWQIDAKGFVSPKEHISTSSQSAKNDHQVNNPYFQTSSNVVCSPLSGGAGSGNTRECRGNIKTHQSDNAGQDGTLSSDHQTKQLNVPSAAGSTSGSTSSNIATKTSDRPSSNVSYICTGMDVYLSHEPCMMCAMALLHSRVRRVFYCLPNAAKGALGSVVRLHTMQGINHRYEVFRVQRKDVLRVVDYGDHGDQKRVLMG